MHLDNVETAKTAMDATAIAIILGFLSNLLPAIATILTIVWMAIRIYETKTVRSWLGVRKHHIRDDKDTEEKS